MEEPESETGFLAVLRAFNALAGFIGGVLALLSALGAVVAFILCSPLIPFAIFGGLLAFSIWATIRWKKARRRKYASKFRMQPTLMLSDRESHRPARMLPGRSANQDTFRQDTPGIGE